MLTDIKKHRGLFAGGALLQLSALMLFMLFNQEGSLSQCWLTNMNSNYSFWLLFFWTWFIAITQITIGSFWSFEIGGRFDLEIWRYRSYTAWLDRKLGVMLISNISLSWLIPLVFLLASSPRELQAALTICGFLILYVTHLSLILIITSLLGGSVTVSFVGILTYNALNLFLDHAGWPNFIQYFLTGEQASATSFIVIFISLCSVVLILRKNFDPSIITKRGSVQVW